MKISNYLYIFIIALLCSTSAMAQMGELRSELAIGVNGGVNMSKVDFSPRIKLQNQSGMSMGITARYMCEKYFKMMCGIQSELN